MDQNNINNTSSLSEAPVFDTTPLNNTPLSTSISPEIAGIGEDIRMRARASLLQGSPTLHGLDLNKTTQAGMSNKVQMTTFDVGRDAFIQLNSGDLIPRFEKYIPGVNNEELLAKNRDDVWSNGLLKLGGKIGTGVIGGTIGSVNGIIQGIKQGSFTAVFNNDFNKYLDDLNTKMDYKLPHYYTQKEKDMNFFEQMGTANFYADKALGGLSFLISTAVSEGIWAAATGGTSLIARGLLGGVQRGSTKAFAGGAMRALKKSKEAGRAIIKGAQKTEFGVMRDATIKASNYTKAINTARFTYTSAAYEAGMESRLYMTDTTREFKDNFYRENGRMPNGAEMTEFNNKLVPVANTLFVGNLALVASSNFVMFGKAVLNKTATKTISNSLFKKTFLGVGFNKLKTGKLEAIKANKFQKVFGKTYAIGKPVFTEGFIEEGGQAVMSTAATDYVLSAYDKDNVNGGFSMMEALKRGMEHTYGTKEGLVEVGLGALIGLFGGAVSSRGRFNEVSQEREQVETTVKYANDFLAKNLVENFKYQGRVSEATSLKERAAAEGNLTEEMRADVVAMAAVAERAYHYQSTKETIQDFNEVMDSMDDAAFQDEYGLSNEEMAEWKAQKKQQFSELVEEHTKNLEFAESIVGGTPIAGLDTVLGDRAIDLKGAIAYTITMGNKSDEFAESLANQIKLTVSDYLGGGSEVDAVTVNEVLRKIEIKKYRDYRTLGVEVKNLTKKRDRLLREKVEAERLAQLNSKEDNQTYANRINKIQKELIEVEEKLQQATNDKTLAFEAMNIPQLTEEVVTEDMLDNQTSSVDSLAQTIETIKLRDPKTGDMLEQLTEEYGRAMDSAKAFNELVNKVIDPKTRVNTLSGWLGKIVNRKKELGESNAELFTNLIKNYDADLAGSSTGGGSLWQSRAKAEKEKIINTLLKRDSDLDRTELNKKSFDELTRMMTEEAKSTNPLENPPEDIPDRQQEEEVEDPTATVQSVIEKLKAKIKNLIEKNPYTNLEYEGREIGFNDVAPSQQELDRYNELLNKIEGGSLSAILNNPFRPKNPRGLTKEETKELQDLNLKLNNWKILSGTTNEINDSVADMLTLINQLEKEHNLIPTKVKISPLEIVRSVKSAATGSRNAFNTIVTPDIAVAKKTAGTNNYEISHLNATTLLRLFPNSKLFALINGKLVDVTTMPVSKLEIFQKQEGSEFSLVTAQGQDIKVTISDRQRLVMDIEALEQAMPDSGFTILDFGHSTFMPVFIKDGDTYSPLQGDFRIESINENEVITLDSEKLYELPEGTPLRTVVNLNDKFNAQLIKDFKDGKITEEELINNLHIYISPKGAVNSIVGSLRAIKNSLDRKSDTYAKLHLIRKRAAKKALRSSSRRVEVGITIPLKKVLFGSPNMVVEIKDGKVVPVNKRLTSEDLSQIEDYGYILDGEIFTNKNLSVSEKEAIFATALSSKEANKGKKIPIVIFKYKNNRVVFPVTLVEKPGTKARKVYEILTDNTVSDAAKLVNLNEFLINNNIDPKSYPIADISSEASIEEINRLLRDLQGSKEDGTLAKDTVNVETWLDPNHNKQTLLDDIEIGIDISNKPFNAPKGILDFNGVVLPNEDTIRIEVVESLDEMAKRTDRIFREKEPFSNMRNETPFYETYVEKEIDPQASSYIRKQMNANILIKMFSNKIPKSVKNALGDDMVRIIKADIKEYNLIQQGLKANSKAAKTTLSSELKEQENKCND